MSAHHYMALSPDPPQAVTRSRGLAETASRLLARTPGLRAAAVWINRSSLAVGNGNGNAGNDMPIKVCRVGTVSRGSPRGR